MKKILCLALVVITMLALFTGCAGRTYMNSGSYGRGNRGYHGMNDYGNVSTSDDGTVNGGNVRKPMPRMNPNTDMGAMK